MIVRSILEAVGLVAKPTRKGLKVLTGVRAELTADHRSRDTGKVHGHTWIVTVWLHQGNNAVMVREHLASLVSHYDGKCLPDNIAWAEDLAAYIFHQMECAASGWGAWMQPPVSVEITREKEGLLARVEAA